MKTYKKGISLIVLVITVIVLSILATTVIISLSNTNIINQTNSAVFKSDMANLKSAYELYVASKLIDDRTYDRTSLSLSAASNAAEFTEIFGNNVPENYKNNLEIVAGRLVYKTAEPELVSVLKGLDMAITVKPAGLTVGDTVEYTPTADPNGTYSGATYVYDKDTESDTYKTYIESTTNYTPGTLKWVYLGQDEAGNVLLTSQETTSFTMTISGQDGFVTGPDRMDTLCNTLYGNSVYAQETRNMKIEDVNIVLGYTGPKGSYLGKDIRPVTTDEALTFEEIEKKEGIKLIYRETPRLSQTAFEDYMSDKYHYVGTTYKGETTDEYKLIFNKGNSSIYLPTYWLSSTSAYVYPYASNGGYARFYVRHVNGLYDEGVVNSDDMCNSVDTEWSGNKAALRPVIVLKSNIQFGEKNSNGEWKLVEM